MKHTTKKERDFQLDRWISSLIFNQIRIIDLSFIQIFGMKYFDNMLINEVAFISCVNMYVMFYTDPYVDEDLENSPLHTDEYTDLRLNALAFSHSNAN